MKNDRGIIWLTGMESVFKSSARFHSQEIDPEEFIDKLFKGIAAQLGREAQFDIIYEGCLECIKGDLRCLIIANPRLPEVKVDEFFSGQYNRIVFLTPLRDVRKWELCQRAAAENFTFLSMQLPQYEYRARENYEDDDEKTEFRQSLLLKRFSKYKDVIYQNVLDILFSLLKCILNSNCDMFSNIMGS